MALVRSTCAQEATDLHHPHDHDDAMAVMALVPSTPAQEAMELHHPHGHSEAMAIMRLVPSTSAQEAMECNQPPTHLGHTHQSIEFQSPNHHGHTQQAIKFRSPTHHQAPNYHSHGRQTAMEFQSPHHNPSPKYRGLAQQAMEFPSPIPHHHEFQSPAYLRHGQEAMEFPSPNNFRHSSSVKDLDLMWRPGSPAYMANSSGREHMDRLRCKQELQKLYEETSESSYDLSLKDIVDPCYSISGNLKAIIAEQGNLKAQVRVVNETRNKKGSAIPKLSFSFSFPGLRGKGRTSSSSSHDNFSPWKASPSDDVKDKQASTPKSTRNPKLCSSPETQRSSMSRIHPFNHCSACSAYTIFFKCHCLVCGRLYCSSCAKERMDELLNGRKCKESCQSGALRKRLSRNVGSRCWPFCSSADVKMLQLYSSAENHA